MEENKFDLRNDFIEQESVKACERYLFEANHIVKQKNDGMKVSNHFELVIQLAKVIAIENQTNEMIKMKDELLQSINDVGTALHEMIR